jgi:hypothetical protein
LVALIHVETSSGKFNISFVDTVTVSLSYWGPGKHTVRGMQSVLLTDFFWQSLRLQY